MNTDNKKTETKQCTIPSVSSSYLPESIKYAEKSGNNMDKMGKIFNKTKDGRPCYWSELSYHETNDL